VAAAVGFAVKTQRELVVEAQRRAAEAEARSEEEAMRRVDEERLRIARELHDVTAHSLSVIAVQSGAAAHVIDTDTAAARKALTDIKRTSREALAELRSVVGSLRSEGEAAEDAPLSPQPGLSRIGELLRPLEQSGVRVDLTVEGDLSALPQLVDASAYRIVQEALTNVIRHAGKGASARVDVRVTPLEVELTIADDGTGGVPQAGGHGLAGMRERALALGGSFEAGPQSPRGWRVAASLPLSGRRQS
jgi:signal transduction histidine kinase